MALLTGCGQGGNADNPTGGQGNSIFAGRGAERQEPVIVESGWSNYHGGLANYVLFGLVITNPSTTHRVDNCKVVVHYNLEGASSAQTKEYFIGMIWPGETVFYTDSREISRGTALSLDFEVEVSENNWSVITSEEAAAFKPLEVSVTEEKKEDYSLKFIGNVINHNSTFDVTQSHIMALFRDSSGKILGGYRTLADVSERDGGSDKFEVYMPFGPVPYDSVEFYALVVKIRD
jgi:hypothetical protein